MSDGIEPTSGRADTETAQIANSLLNFVERHFPLARKRHLGPHEDLLEAGVVDSLGVLELVNFIEQQFGLAVTDDDLTPENFKSIHRVAHFVVSKRDCERQNAQ